VANPITILIEQAGQGPGTAGVSRDDLIIGALCTVTDPANIAGGGTWAWALVVPNGSSTTGAGGTTNTFTFTPDKAGTYLVYLVYDDGTEVLSYSIDAVGQYITDQGGAGVKDAHGHRYIGFGETQQFGARGWDPAVDGILRNTSALLTAPVSHAPSHLNAGGDTLAADVVKTTTGPTDMVVGAVADGEYLKRVGSTIVGDTPAGSTTAEALGTTGADVDVGSAAPPTAGQVLKADDPTHATWQDPQVLSSAQGDYIQANMTADQLSPLSGDAVDVDNILRQRGSLALDTVTNVGRFSGLKAGRTYLLMAGFRCGHSTSACGVTTYWYDVTGAAAIGQTSRSRSYDWNTNHLGGAFPATAVFTPTEDTEVEVRVSSPSPADVKVMSGSSYATITEIGAVQANVIGGLEFMDIIEVGAPTNLLTFGAGGDGTFQRALDGDVDQTYVIDYRLANTGTSNISLRPNGVITNQEGARWTGGSSLAYFTTLVICDPTGAGDEEEGSIEFNAARVRGGIAQPRTYRSLSGLWDTTSSNVLPRGCSGRWNETASNITSMEIAVEGGGNEIAAGSYAILWRKTRNNVRADSASTYERNVEAVVAQGSAGPTTYTTGNAVFGGSALGIGVSLIDDSVVSGTITVQFKVGGTVVLTAVLDSVNTSFHRAAAPINFIPVAAGDAIEIDITTASLVTTAAGSPAVSISLMLSNNAFIQPPTGPDYLIAALSAAQTARMAVNNHIEFDLSSQRGTSIALATGVEQANGLFTLQPGKVYEIHANLQAEVNEGHLALQWRDHSDDSVLVDDTGQEASYLWFVDNSAHDQVPMPSMTIVYTPSIEITIKLDVSQSDNPVHWDIGSRVLIKEL